MHVLLRLLEVACVLPMYCLPMRGRIRGQKAKRASKRYRLFLARGPDVIGHELQDKQNSIVVCLLGCHVPPRRAAALGPQHVLFELAGHVAQWCKRAHDQLTLRPRCEALAAMHRSAANAGGAAPDELCEAACR